MPAASSYAEAQADEIEALRAIYADDFTDVKAKSAWKTSERAFKLKLASYSDQASFVVLQVTLTATYPKTLPVIKLDETQMVSAEVLTAIRDVINTKPRQLLGEVMIHELASTIQDLIEDAAAGLAQKASASAQVPSLGQQRDAKESEDSAIEQMQREAAIRREKEEQAARERQVQLQIDEEMARRDKTRLQRVTSSDMADINEVVPTVPIVAFDQITQIQDLNGHTLMFKAVRILSDIKRGSTSSIQLVSPATSSLTSSLLALKSVRISEHVSQNQVLELEKSLERLKLLRNPKLVNLLNFRAERVERSWQFQVLYEASLDHRSLTDLLLVSEALPTNKARLYGLDILQALDYLHRNGVVHGCLTTDNVLISTDTGGNVSVRLGGAEIEARVEAVRTPKAVEVRPWQAPELQTSSHSGTRKSDVWDFGVVLIQMILGTRACTDYISPARFLQRMDLSEPFEDLLQHVFDVQPRNRPDVFDIIPYEFFRVNDAPLQTVAEPQTPRGGTKKSFPGRGLHRKSSAAGPTTALSRYANEWDEVGRLGKGGYGEVVKCRNKLDGRIYAIKKIMHKTPAELNQVLSEVHVLAQLNHPYVVRYYGAWPENEDANTAADDDETSLSSLGIIVTGTGSPSFSFEPSNRGLDFISSSGYPKIEFGNDSDDENAASEDDSSDYDSTSASVEERPPTAKTRTMSRPNVKATLHIQMEFCERLTLRDLIRRDLSSKTDDVWRLLRQLLEGLVHIHSLGIIHRDLKPENVFIDATGGPRIGDFGLATSGHSIRPERATNSHGQGGDMTSNVGTTFYVAPEVQSRAAGGYTSKVDMYSLGIVLFEMCCPLPTAMERTQTLNALRRKDHQLPPELLSKEKAIQGEIVEILVSHQVSARPTAAELLHSGKVPVRIEDETVRLALKGLADEDSPYHQRIMSALFSSAPEKGLKAQIWDRSDREASQSPTIAFAIMQDSVKATMTECFRRHGAVPISRQGLMPWSSFYEGKNVYKMMDATGTMVQLPYDLIFPFARMVARQLTIPERSYTFGTVFRDALNNGAPRTNREADFDIVANNGKDAALHEAEVIKLMDELTYEFPSLAAAPMCFHVSHTDLLDIILTFCRIPKAQHAAVKEVLGRLHIHGWTWQKIRAELRSPSIGVSSSSLDELARFDFRDTAQKTLTKLQQVMVGGSLSEVHKIFMHLAGLIEYCTRLGVRRKIYVSPLSTLNDKFYSGGVSFQCLFDNKKRDVLAAGGRYDKLIEAHGPSSESSNATRHGAGISIAWDTIVSSMIRYEGLSSNAGSFLKKEEQAPPQWPIRRCDVLVASLDASTLRASGVRLLAELWASDISAELAKDCNSQEELLNHYRDDKHSWIIIIRHEATTSSRADLRVKSMIKKEDFDVQNSELIPFLRTEIRERDQQEGTWRNRQMITAAESAFDKAEVHVLLSSHKSKKSNKMRIVEGARTAAKNLLDTFAGAPVAAIETSDALLTKLKETRLSDADSWRRVIQEAPLNERQYMRELQEEIEKLKSTYADHRNCFVHNFRTGSCIYYDMSA